MTFSHDTEKEPGGMARIFGGSVIFALCLGAIAACESDSPTSAPVIVESASFAKGGPGGGGSTAPTVGSVAPTAAAQDTTIDVNIFGAGFTNGAAATWSLNGDTTKVHVKSTKFVSSTQLVARISVPVDAPVARYDVVVMLIGGKKGVGAELFEVTLGDPKTDFYFPPPTSSLSLRGDGNVIQGTDAYASGVCGVDSKIFVSNGGGDATLSTSNPRFSDRKCAAYPRKLMVSYADGVIETGTTFINVRALAQPSSPHPLNATVKRGLAVNLGTRCDRLLFASERDGTPVDGDSVNVTRVAANTWRVQTQPFPYNRAYCFKTGASYYLSVDFTIVADRDLP